MLEVLKDKMEKSIKEIHENTNKRWRIMNGIVQDLQIETESITKTQTEGQLKRKGLNRNLRGKPYQPNTKDGRESQ